MKALSDRRETQLLYDNLRNTFAAGKYPDNSSSIWTSRGCQRRGRCSRNIPSIPLTYRQSAAPLRRKARYSHSVYSIEGAGHSFVPSLPQRAKLEEYGLDNVKLFVQPSGFQTGEIFSRWIEDVFVPMWTISESVHGSVLS